MNLKRENICWFAYFINSIFSYFYFQYLSTYNISYYFWYLSTINFRYFYSSIILLGESFSGKISVLLLKNGFRVLLPPLTYVHINTHTVFLYHLAVYCPQLACMAVILTPSTTCVVGPHPHQRIQRSLASSSGPGRRRPRAQARTMTFQNLDVSGNSLVYLIVSCYITLY